MSFRSLPAIVLVLLLLSSACGSDGSADGAAVLSSTVDRPTATASVETTVAPTLTSPTEPDGAVVEEEAVASGASTTSTSTSEPAAVSTTDASPTSMDGSDAPPTDDVRANDTLTPATTEPPTGDEAGDETTSSTTLLSTTSVVATTTDRPVTSESTSTSTPTTVRTTTIPPTTAQSAPVETTTRPTTTTSSTTARPTTTVRPTTTAIPTTTVRPAPVDTSVFPRTPVVRSGAQMLVETGFAGLEGKRVGLIVNHVSRVGSTHLIDVFDRAPEVELVAIFGPEHGVRGTADAGEKVDNDVDTKTGTPILSLYGKTRKPTPSMLEGVDVLVFDLQDVGTRFYTYISTMGLAMQAAAAADIEFVVLDRPNPLGGVDTGGFSRLAAQDSFIGQYPIPATYALTAGELARAVKGERWLPGLAGLDLRVVELEGWNRRMLWPDTGMPWIGPSPGLPTFESALAYPGTVLLEATTLSYGTGTYHPFSTLGAPWIDQAELAADLNSRGLPGVWFLPVTYTPRVIEGLSVRPRLEDEQVHGVRYVFTDYRTFEPVRTGVHLLDAVRRQAEANDIDGWIDRPKTFDLLSGNPTLRRMILNGDDPDKIASTWAADNRRFDAVRARYELYR